jgi:CRISPR-associated protein Csm1
MNDFTKYFHKDFEELKPNTIDVNTLFSNRMSLIVGDFYGIQKFIFDRLATKNASKVLRAKSAFVQIFTEYLAKYICFKLGIDEKYILSVNAGKFEILVPIHDVDLTDIQKKVDEYFLKNFYGLSGVTLCSLSCVKEDFRSKENYKKFRKEITNELEKHKFKKFNLGNRNAILSYDTNIDNQTLCKICNIRKIEKKNCTICDSFIELGKRLSFEHIDEIVSSYKIGIDFDDDFIIDIKLTDKIKSYILFDANNSPVDFKTLAESSCAKLETGVKALGILKADVDNMGKYLERSDVTDSFENFDMFSKSMDNFFSLYIPKKLMRKKYKNTYTVFAGGDDLFLVGAWDEILDMAREIERVFKVFIKGDELSISFGIAIAKPSTPISYLADYTEKLLEEAKDIDKDKEVENSKNAISLFGETVKWDEYKKVFNRLYELFKDFEIVNAMTLYRLMIFCNMSKNIKEDIKNTMWKSKLNYLFSKNIDKKYHYLLEALNESIEKSPEATKMFLSEFIYKRRD